MTKFTYPPLSNLVFTLSLYMELHDHGMSVEALALINMMMFHDPTNAFKLYKCGHQNSKTNIINLFVLIIFFFYYVFPTLC